MNMHVLDWTIVFGVLAFLILVAAYTKRYNKSVADFMVANRCAGRYLIAAAMNMSGMGAITILAYYEMFYKGGFGAAWWFMLLYVTPIIIALCGWTIYRYRQTRVMTLAQFFEIRYGRRFRVFSGILCFLSGILNFGIFPAVGARFFVYFCGFPQYVHFGSLAVSTFALTMLVLLSISLYFTFAGGQITVIATDFLQGVICSILFLMVLIYLMTHFEWSDISQALLKAPTDASLVNPFRGANVEDFNMWYFIIGTVLWFYNYISWQGAQGYYLCALNPTEQKIGMAMSYLRSITQNLSFVIVAVCAYTIMNNVRFQAEAANVSHVLNSIESETIQKQMLVPTALTMFLGKVMLGFMCTIVLVAFISTHDTYLHSWGSMFIQDVIMPFRKKPFTPKRHMLLLRTSITGVAIFIFLWSLFFPLKESILLYFAITGAIYLGGAGAAIVGGLYWKRGTAAAAFWAMIVGSVLAVGGIIIRQIKPDFPINGQWMYLITTVVSSSLYVAISLLGKRTEFNMDRMLHRGKYADEKNSKEQTGTTFSRILEKLGIEKNFSRKDKLTYACCMVLPVIYSCVFIIGTIYNLFINRAVSDQSWLRFWYVWMIFIISAFFIVTLWQTIGGLKNFREMLRMLRTIKRDDADDGTVVHGHNLDEANTNAP